MTDLIQSFARGSTIDNVGGFLEHGAAFMRFAQQSLLCRLPHRTAPQRGRRRATTAPAVP